MRSQILLLSSLLIAVSCVSMNQPVVEYSSYDINQSVERIEDGTYLLMTDKGKVPFTGYLIQNDGNEGLVECPHLDGKPHGTMIHWTNDTRRQKVFELSYRHGLENGEYRYWHDNGVLKTQGRYKDGEKVGLWRRWDKNGNLISQVERTEKMTWEELQAGQNP